MKNALKLNNLCLGMGQSENGMTYYVNPYEMDENGNYTDKNGNVTSARTLDMVGFHLGPRTKSTNPYSYDALLQWKKYDTTPENAGAVYSDRLFQHNHAKYRSLCEKHFAGIDGDRGGDYFGARSPSRIEAFLREYYDNPKLELVRIEEHCNQSSGYPVWAFFYVDPTRADYVEVRDVKPTPKKAKVAKTAKAIPAKAPAKKPPRLVSALVQSLAN